MEIDKVYVNGGKILLSFSADKKVNLGKLLKIGIWNALNFVLLISLPLKLPPEMNALANLLFLASFFLQNCNQM